MSSDWIIIKKIFSEAIDLAPEDRENYVRKATEAQPEYYDEVMSLLKAHEQPGLLDNPFDSLKASFFEDNDENFRTFKNKKIGPYKINKELGRGGMGRVFFAERDDEQFTQKVALKLIPGGITSENQTLRFLSERQILANLNHPNIAKLFDGGITDYGLPWFAMEYIDGKPIDLYCDEKHLSIPERLELFRKVCDAVQYAHQKLVVHRDLKPSNILVKDNGTVKLLDFGIAKILNPDQQDASGVPLTQTGLLPLTPAYASPEQVRGDTITTASDIYQLGVVLYELLSGCRPYEVTGRSPSEIEQIICREEPTRPSTAITNISKNGNDREMTPERAGKMRQTKPRKLQKKLRGDLDTIILKALRKEPERRYESADKLRSDIDLYLSDRPVTAHPDSRLYRAGKYIQRHRLGVGAVVAIFISLVIGISAALWQNQKAETALERTEQALGRAEVLHGFLMDLFLPGTLDRPAGQMPTTEELLDLGAQQALDENFTSPSERLGMLVTIAEIYIRRGWANEAKPLIEAAVELGMGYREEWPQDLARALNLQARIASWEGAHEKSARLYERAESLLEGMDQYRDLFSEIRTGRSYFEYYRGNYNLVLELMEPLYEEIIEKKNPGPHLETRMMNLFAITYGFLGKLEKAVQYQNQVIENYRVLDGDDSRTYAVALTNSIDIKYNLGQFELAEKHAMEAISIYNKLYQEPTSVLSVTYGKLAAARFFEGRFDEALSLLETAGRHFASVRDKNYEEWMVPKVYQGLMLAQMGRWEEATEKLLDSRSYFDQGHHTMYFTSPKAALAEALCRAGKTEEGKSVLTNLHDNHQLSGVDSPPKRASIYEARARCAYITGNFDTAKNEVEKSIESMKYPGRAMERANRKLFLATILKKKGLENEALEFIDKAEQLFYDVDLPGHPVLATVKSARDRFIAEIRRD